MFLAVSSSETAIKSFANIGKRYISEHDLGLKCSFLTKETVDDRYTGFKWPGYSGNTGV